MISLFWILSISYPTSFEIDLTKFFGFSLKTISQEISKINQLFFETS